MFQVLDGATSAGTTGPPDRLPQQLRILDGVTRELMPAVWALGVTCSALRLPADLTRRERELVDAVERGLGRIVRILSSVHDLVLLESQGDVPLEPTASHMGQICDDAIGQVREAGVSEAVRSTEVGEGQGIWDPERLSQAISYLIECAAGAAPVDDPEVRLHWKGGAFEVQLVVERAAGPDEQVGIDLEWGGAFDGCAEGGARSAVARSIVLGHGGSLARFASRCSVAYVASLPRGRASERN